MSRSFDGNTANYLDAGDVAAIDIVGDYLSVAFWFRWAGSGSTHFPVAKSGTSVGSVQYSCELLNTGVATFGISDDTDQDKVTGVLPIINGKWYHYAAVKDGLVGNSLRLYLNGKLDSVLASARSITNKVQSLRFGQRQGGPGYVGLVAHVGIWNVALTADEIKQLAMGWFPSGIRPDSLRGYWPLDDYSSTGASKDRSRYNNDATVVGTLPYSLESAPVGIYARENTWSIENLKRPGASPGGGVVYRSAYSPRDAVRDFPAGGNVLTVGDVAAVDITGTAISVSCWINPDAVNIRASIAKSDNNVTNQYLLYTSSGGNPQFLIGNGAGSNDLAIGASVLPIGRWSHIGGYKNGTGANALAVIMNGLVNGTATSNLSIGNTAHALIFGSVTGGGFPFDGRIADVAIWDTVLTPGEFFALYQGINPMKIRPGNLRGYWPLNDYGDAGQSRDLWIFNNPAALTGSVGLVRDSRPTLADGVDGFYVSKELTLGVHIDYSEALAA